MDGLRAKAIYTVREVITDELTDNIAIRLEEIDRPITGNRTVEPGYWIEHFRPIVTRTQSEDVAQFERLLDVRRVEEKA